MSATFAGHEPSTSPKLNIIDMEPSKRAPGQNIPKNSDYTAFLAGAFSGVVKTAVGHPFDTIKVRLQTSNKAQFSGPWQCFLETTKSEGYRALYKGVGAPVFAWIFMDSLMFGSMEIYRKILAKTIFSQNRIASSKQSLSSGSTQPYHLPILGHAVAGAMAGFTVSFLACPFEHVKARLQIQYAVQKGARMYSGTFDCGQKIWKHHGIRGLYHGLQATIIFRSFFFFWWGSSDVIARTLREKTNFGNTAVNLCAGGLAAQVFWITSYPSDVIKQRIMTDPLGGSLGDGVRKFPNWKAAAVTIYRENGPRGFWRGFLPCFLRAAPTNAAAFTAYRFAMDNLP